MVRHMREATDDRPNNVWLEWFMHNHPMTDLIPLNLWKKAKYLISDILGVDGAADAIRAAYLLEGYDAAMSVMVPVLLSLFPADGYVPELPPEWRDRVRFRSEKYQDPDTRPKFFGVFRADR